MAQHRALRVATHATTLALARSTRPLLCAQSFADWSRGSFAKAVSVWQGQSLLGPCSSNAGEEDQGFTPASCVNYAFWPHAACTSSVGSANLAVCTCSGSRPHLTGTEVTCVLYQYSRTCTERQKSRPHHRPQVQRGKILHRPLLKLHSSHLFPLLMLLLASRIRSALLVLVVHY